jgi:hypothetical protein
MSSWHKGSSLFSMNTLRGKYIKLHALQQFM